MAKIITNKTHNSGIALGGLGTGTVELLPDGEFHYWQIANSPRLTTRCHEKKVDDGESSTGALSFWIRTQEDGKNPIIRKLGMKTDAEDFTYRMFGWNKPAEQIEFDGKFPVCNLKYTDSALPCNISMQAVAPFVPHNSDYSATPGFYIDFNLENPTDNPLNVSLLGVLNPDFANKECCTKNTLSVNDGTYSIHLSPVEVTDSPDCGNVCISLSGDGEKSYITADFRRYLKEYIAYSDEFGVTQESVLFDFKENGYLPNSNMGTEPTAIPDELDSLSDDEIDSLCAEYIQYPFAVSLLKRINHFTPDFPSGRAEKEKLLKLLSRQIKRMNDKFGSCALCGNVELAPGEKKVIRYVLSWYFPNHIGENGNMLGHYYENLFSDALDANRFLVKNSAKIHDKAVAFSNLLFSTDMPSFYPDCWSSHLSTLVKSSWYLKDGKFALWEGLGYCGFHTTDITYHASFGLLALFPNLQKKQMLMGAEFQRDDGRVHHFFTPDLEHVDNGFDRVDMNMQFVMMVLRDFLYTGDRKYLSCLWNNVVRAMDSIESLDTDGDGLPDSETKRNTYDAWNFSGIPAYISFLWISALKAAVMIAEKMNDNEKATHWQTILEKGKASLEEKLWNGEYYNLWCNENQTDESLMTDQLDGEWFLRIIGIGGNLSDERVQQIVKFIFDHNFDAEQGLINASCPQNKQTSIHTYKNCQTTAVWTGIDYAFAALALSVGLNDISDTIINSVHNNQMRFGSFWDHWECGHHYTRPLSSWTTLTAALGLFVDSENKIISLNPPVDNITLPLCTCNTLATVTFKDNKCEITCIEGDFNDWNVKLPVGMKLVINCDKQ